MSDTGTRAGWTERYVVSAADGPMPEHAALYCQLVRLMLPISNSFLNKADMVQDDAKFNLEELTEVENW